jgi:hypothetical protein
MQFAWVPAPGGGAHAESSHAEQCINVRDQIVGGSSLQGQRG